MRILYLDIFAGISGDMFLGALLDLGLSDRVLRRELGRLHVHNYRLRVQRASQSGISGTRFAVELTEASSHRHAHGPHGPHTHLPHEHRSFADIRKLLAGSDLDAAVRKRALSIFQRIAVAEGKIHGVPPARVHFHEVGGVDSIVDIVGAAIGVRELGVERVCAREVEEGSGFIEMAHGRYPVPTPAMLEILRGVTVRQCAEPNEMVTPTGAAILAEFVSSYGPMPPLKIEGVGYGLGTRRLQTRPNVLRAVLGETADSSTVTPPATVSVIETNLDDMNPQWFGDVMERLFAAGALDVFFTPIQMKKNRPGTLLTVLCEPGLTEKLVPLLLEHTTTFGVRLTEARRQVLDRETRLVPTRFGPISVKIGRWKGRPLSVAPEYESCRQAAARAKVPVKTVYAEALQRARSAPTRSQHAH